MSKVLSVLILSFTFSSFASGMISIPEMKSSLAAGEGLPWQVDVSSLSDSATCGEIRSFLELKQVKFTDNKDVSEHVICTE